MYNLHGCTICTDVQFARMYKHVREGWVSYTRLPHPSNTKSMLTCRATLGATLGLRSSCSVYATC